MTVKECYDACGADFEEAMGRMMKEDRVKKFARMFLRDTSYQQLVEMVDAGDTEEAFKAAHTLKGVAANVSLKALYEIAVEVTESLRNNDLETARTFMPELVKRYDMTVEAINQIED